MHANHVKSLAPENEEGKEPVTPGPMVLESWESRDKAEAVYGVRFTGTIEDDSLAADAATEARRTALRAAR
jgi:hypothetical protein